MHCIKLLGQGLMARDFDRQVAELQIRIAVLNRYTALGIPVKEPVGSGPIDFTFAACFTLRKETDQ
jgi:hypothetical protein